MKDTAKQLRYMAHCKAVRPPVNLVAGGTTVKRRCELLEGTTTLD